MKALRKRWNRVPQHWRICILAWSCGHLVGTLLPLPTLGRIVLGMATLAIVYAVGIYLTQKKDRS